MTNKLIKLAAGSALVALALTGCGSADSETPASDASESASSNERPVAASAEGPAQNVRVPAETELLSEQSATGLKTFVYHWLEYNSYAQQTGETDKLNELSADGCQYCADEIEMINGVYADGGWMAGADPRVSNIYPEVAEGADTGTALVVYSETDGTVYGADGNSASAIEPMDATILTFEASFADGSWTMESVEETPDAELPEAE